MNALYYLVVWASLGQGHGSMLTVSSKPIERCDMERLEVEWRHDDVYAVCVAANSTKFIGKMAEELQCGAASISFDGKRIELFCQKEMEAAL